MSRKCSLLDWCLTASDEEFFDDIENLILVLTVWSLFDTPDDLILPFATTIPHEEPELPTRSVTAGRRNRRRGRDEVDDDTPVMCERCGKISKLSNKDSIPYCDCLFELDQI